MYIVNVTDVRRNIRQILAKLVKTKEPVVILQRSRPVAYLVDPERFEKMQKTDEGGALTEDRRRSLERILQLRVKVANRTGMHEDSAALIRDLREGLYGRE
ncbi:MAG: type II toxin-antitoxin system Phd/YefM family antitoxin [Bacillota bacterium]